MLSIRTARAYSIKERISPRYNRNMRCCSQLAAPTILITARHLLALIMIWLTCSLKHRFLPKWTHGYFNVRGLSADTPSKLTYPVHCWCVCAMRLSMSTQPSPDWPVPVMQHTNCQCRWGLVYLNSLAVCSRHIPLGHLNVSVHKIQFSLALSLSHLKKIIIR